MSLRYNLLILILLILSGCKTSHTAKNNKTSLYKSEVFACYYHNKFNGRKTASGEVFSNKKLTAAHKKLPFGTLVKVTNPQNKKSVIVIDRKSTRLNSSHVRISYAVFCLKKKKNNII